MLLVASPRTSNSPKRRKMKSASGKYSEALSASLIALPKYLFGKTSWQRDEKTYLMPRSALILSRNPYGKAMKTIHPCSPGLSAPSSQIFLQKSSVTPAATLSVSQASDQPKRFCTGVGRDRKKGEIVTVQFQKTEQISSACKMRDGYGCSLTLDALHTEVV